MRRYGCETISGTGSRTCCPGVRATSALRPRTIGCSWKPCSTIPSSGFVARLTGSALVNRSRSTRASRAGPRTACEEDVRVSGGRADNETPDDSPIERARQHQRWRPKKEVGDQAIGRSKGGLSTKIHTLVDALGNPISFFLTPGQAHDLQGADALLPQVKADILLADKAFDADEHVIKDPAAQKRHRPRTARTITTTVRQAALQGPSSHRELLLQAQAIPSHRHSIRQDRSKLPRRYPPRRCYHLAQLRTGPNLSMIFLCQRLRLLLFGVIAGQSFGCGKLGILRLWEGVRWCGRGGFVYSWHVVGVRPCGRSVPLHHITTLALAVVALA